MNDRFCHFRSYTEVVDQKLLEWSVRADSVSTIYFGPELFWFLTDLKQLLTNRKFSMWRLFQDWVSNLSSMIWSNKFWFEKSIALHSLAPKLILTVVLTRTKTLIKFNMVVLNKYIFMQFRCWLNSMENKFSYEFNRKISIQLN